MTANEYIELFLMSKTETVSGQADEGTASEVADLVSGSFVYSLFEFVFNAGLETDALTQHLEELYDSANYCGIIYFIMILADATGYYLPKEFYMMSVKNELAHILSAAIIEDWLEASE